MCKKNQNTCISCGYVVLDDNPFDYELQHNRYKCPKCGSIFYDVDGTLTPEQEYNDMNDTSWAHPNESYEDFCEHENFD